LLKTRHDFLKKCHVLLKSSRFFFKTRNVLKKRRLLFCRNPLNRINKVSFSEKGGAVCGKIRTFARNI